MTGGQISSEIYIWPARLEQVIASQCTTLKRVTVLRETDSTQDAARRMNGKPGDVFIAWRQTAGRGRLGRQWADTAENGIAMTIVLDRGAYQPAALAVSAAVGTAMAIESVLNRPAGIKWPNDVMIQGRKNAGILIDRSIARPFCSKSRAGRLARRRANHGAGRCWMISTATQ